MTAVLLLNADYSPLRTISLQRALSLIFGERVEQVESVPDRQLRSPSIAIPFPSVLRLKIYRSVPQRRAVWSRRAVFERDNYVCVFCGEKLDHKSATLDHLIPKQECSRLGIRPSTWGNSACSCRRCNFRKSNRTMRDAGMKFFDPKFEPKTPRTSYVVASGNIPTEWKMYLER